jgi:alpha-L-arabinofuranosidase
MVGTQEYIFKTSGTAQGDVVISANTTTQAENLVTSITRDSTNVTATNNAGVVTVVAAIKGTAGNGIVLSEAAHPVTGLAVSSVTDGKLDGGIDGTVGVANETVADDTYIYHSIATNDTTGTNWRRIALGTVF